MKIIKTVFISSVIAAAIFGAQAFGQDSGSRTPTSTATHDATSEPSLFLHAFSHVPHPAKAEQQDHGLGRMLGALHQHSVESRTS